MAARLRPRQADDCRLKIQTTQLINRVQDYALGKLSDEDISSTRLNAIKILLAKSLPDLSSVEISNKDGEPFVVEIVRFSDKK